MGRKIKTICVGLMLLLTVLPGVMSDIEQCDEETVYVDDDAGSSWYDATHVKTIQEGIDNASDTDMVFVYNGTYNMTFGHGCHNNALN